MINGIPSPAEIEANRTKNGGWNRAHAYLWGLDWPLPKGWKQQLADRYFEQQLALMTPEEQAQVVADLDQIEAADAVIAEAKALRLRHQQRLNAILRRYDGSTPQKAAPPRTAVRDRHADDDAPWWSEAEWAAGRRGVK
jgi:hypothetical protein